MDRLRRAKKKREWEKEFGSDSPTDSKRKIVREYPSAEGGGLHRIRGSNAEGECGEAATGTKKKRSRCS